MVHWLLDLCILCIVLQCDLLIFMYVSPLLNGLNTAYVRQKGPKGMYSWK